MHPIIPLIIIASSFFIILSFEIQGQHTFLEYSLCIRHCAKQFGRYKNN